jgi:broad specificity phosphatase PhoE
MYQDAKAQKTVYFVRHGQSEGNVKRVHGHPNHPLTETGHQQAQKIAQRVGKLPVQALLASSMVRAKETADAISVQLNIPVEVFDVFIEAEGPSKFFDTPREAEESLKAQKAIQENYHDPNFQYDDEETFPMLRERALKALDLIAARPEEHICVVTHGFFMRVMMACAIMGASLTAEDCRKFTNSFHMQNTGLTILGYDADELASPWWLWVWNDHAHLAD